MRVSPNRTSIVFAVILAGSATLYACSDSSKTTQPAQTVASISLTSSATDALTSLGDTRTITAVALDAKQASIASPSLTWSSSAPSVATVSGSGNSAIVTSVGNGAATITATSGSVNGSVNVTVAQRAASIGLGGAPSSMQPGATAQINADARDAKQRVVSGVTGFTYASSNQSVAVINANGVVTAITPGTTTITGNATVSGVAISGTSAITVAFGTSIPLTAAVTATEADVFTPPTVTVATGGTVNWTFQSKQHNVTFRSATGAPSSIGNTVAAQASRSFPTAGVFTYDCTLHAGMTGTVLVQSASTAPGFTAILNAANERPNPNASTGAGAASFVVNGTTVTYTVTFAGLSGAPVAAHIHGPGSASQAVGVLVDFQATGQTLNNGVLTGTFNASNIRAAGTAAPISIDSLFTLMRNGNAYVNVHTAQFPGGEIRGQVGVPQ